MTSKVLTKTHTNEAEIKKSLFIGVCGRIDSADHFFDFLAQHQDLNATHNCWAFRVGQTYRFNDDGEPSGTAGKPILAAIDGAGFDRIGAIVIRHYGGIKLGTGGLARAYGGTIAKNLQVAPWEQWIPTSELHVQLPFEFSQLLFKVTEDHGGEAIDQTFNETGVLAAVKIPDQQIKQFKKDLNNQTRGQVSFPDDANAS